MALWGRYFSNGPLRLRTIPFAHAGPHDLVERELDDRNGEHLRLDQVDDRAQTRCLAQVALAHISVNHHGTILPDAGEEGLHFGRSGILRFVEEDEGVAP